MLWSPYSSGVSFRVGDARFTATLSSVGGSGLLWIRPDVGWEWPDLVRIIDDPSFEPWRLQTFAMKGRSDARIVFAEYYSFNWSHAKFFFVSPKGVTEVLGFAHRNPDSLKLIQDKAGNLIEVRFADRWIGAGLRPVKLRSDPAPGKRWCLVSSYRPSTDSAWEPYRSRWCAVSVP